MVQRLEKFYYEKIVPQLMEEFHYKNTHQVPVLEKIVINRGLGDASQNAKLLDSCSKELGMITGQQGVVTRSKKAIAAFKLRQKMPVGILINRDHLWSRNSNMRDFLTSKELKSRLVTTKNTSRHWATV